MNGSQGKNGHSNSTSFSGNNLDDYYNSEEVATKLNELFNQVLIYFDEYISTSIGVYIK